MRIALVAACAGCGFSPTIAGNTGDGGVDSAASDWWNPAWHYRMRLAITAPTALPTGFQIGFPYDLDAAACAGPRDAVRIVGDSTELTRMIDELSPPWLWFRLGTATTYWLYCGNANPTPIVTDPLAVFDRYDDFTTLGSAWVTSGSLSTGGGVVTLQTSATFRSAETFAPNTAVDFIMAPQTGAPTMYFWGGFQNGNQSTAPWVLWNTRSENGLHPEAYDGTSSVQNGSLVSYDTSPRLYGVENYGTSSRYRVFDVPVQTITHTNPITQPLSVRFDNYSSTDTIQIDMARIRKAIDPPPTVTVGPMETYTP